MIAKVSTSLLWLRRDLRLADNPALVAAVSRATADGAFLLPVFVWHRASESSSARSSRRPGDAARWWLSESLSALAGDLRQRGSRLVVRRGAPAETLTRVARQVEAGTVVWATGSTPDERDDDDAVTAALRAASITPLTVADGSRLFPPGEIVTRAGGPFRVFTPFWRACLERGDPPLPDPAPDVMPPPPAAAVTSDLQKLLSDASPLPPGGFADFWEPGEAGPRARLARLLSDVLGSYETTRDRPDLPGTSRLSPHLHWGEVSPRLVLRAVADHVERCEMGSCPSSRGTTPRAAAGAFTRQLVWREFAHHVLDQHPDLAATPLDSRFSNLAWRDPLGDPVAAAELAAWRDGRTGYPLVDAGMRELRTTGWMHNRVRMVCASFLTKHLLVPWQHGEIWFRETLVDADAANNAFGWQWVAGCGADAAPFFRIFNPILQGERHDPHGDYVRRWVPELAALPQRWLHRPLQAPPAVLSAADVRLGTGYPAPIVDHAAARARALDAFSEMRRARNQT